VSTWISFYFEYYDMDSRQTCKSAVKYEVVQLKFECVICYFYVTLMKNIPPAQKKKQKKNPQYQLPQTVVILVLITVLVNCNSKWMKINCKRRWAQLSFVIKTCFLLLQCPTFRIIFRVNTELSVPVFKSIVKRIRSTNQKVCWLQCPAGSDTYFHLDYKIALAVQYSHME